MRWLLAALLLLAFAAACGSGGSSQSGVYIALGDSLSAGVGASDRAATAFVPLVHQSLGEGFELLNLGVAGHTSKDLIETQLDRATTEIRQRNGDDDPDNDVKLVTLEIGGNDLLNVYFSLVIPGICPNVQLALDKPECVDALDKALRDYEPNLKSALDGLRAADPKVPIILMTIYNPFSGGVRMFDELGQLGLEGLPGTPFPEGLNDIIRAQAQETGVTLVDIYPLFQGKALQLIASDLIHPNDEGYRVMADTVIQALEGAR